MKNLALELFSVMISFDMKIILFDLLAIQINHKCRSLFKIYYQIDYAYVNLLFIRFGDEQKIINEDKK